MRTFNEIRLRQDYNTGTSVARIQPSYEFRESVSAQTNGQLSRIEFNSSLVTAAVKTFMIGVIHSC
jgi:hypothetical protein